jgi:hypothetical protein
MNPVKKDLNAEYTNPANESRRAGESSGR